MSKKRLGLIFDFDGTIADSFNQAAEVLTDLSKRHGYKCLPKEELRLYSTREALGKIGVGFFSLPLFVYRARRAMAQRMSTVNPISGAPEMLRDLVQTNDCYVALLTSNSTDNVRHFLEKHDLHTCFNEVCADVSIFGKSKVLRRLLKSSGLPAEQIFLVGDETRDIEAAKKMGVKSVAVPWGYQDKSVLATRSPDHLISSPNDLLEILEKSR